MGPAARDNLTAHFAARGNVPEKNSTIKEIGGVALAHNVARTHVLDTGRKRAAAQQLTESWQRLQAEHVITIHQERPIRLQAIDQLQTPKIYFAQRIGKVRHGFDQVIFNFRQSPLRKLRSEDERVQRNPGVFLCKTGKRVIQFLSGVPEGHRHNRRVREAHRSVSSIATTICSWLLAWLASWFFDRAKALPVQKNRFPPIQVEAHFRDVKQPRNTGQKSRKPWAGRGWKCSGLLRGASHQRRVRSE